VTDFGAVGEEPRHRRERHRDVRLQGAEAVDSADRNTMVTIKVTPQSGDARGDIARTI
jgi:hypothetical protein